MEHAIANTRPLCSGEAQCVNRGLEHDAGAVPVIPVNDVATASRSLRSVPTPVVQASQRQLAETLHSTMLSGVDCWPAWLPLTFPSILLAFSLLV